MPSQYDRERNTEKKRRQRERQRAEAEVVETLSEQEIRDSFGYSSSETRTAEERRRTAERMLGRSSSLVSKAKYLEQAEQGARLVSVRKHETEDQERARVERAMNYAHWRWNGFHAGEIASL